MAKIAIADNNHKKFTGDLIEEWEKQGHEVKYEPGASEFLAQWADIYYVDTWDNNIHYLYKLYHGLHDDMPRGWDNNKKPKIVVRALDWEVWIGLARDQGMIDWVDNIIVIAPHIKDELEKYANFGNKVKLIKPGVNLNKFPLKEKETDGYQIGMVLGDLWKYKNHFGGLDIFTTLYRKDPKWRLHIRGQFENSTYDPTNYEYYLKSRGIENVVKLYQHTEDMNLWYDQIDYLLHPGQKEAFCYAIGEAMAKGIKPVINNFYGAKKIWGETFLYDTHQEALIHFLKGGYQIKPNLNYRHFIQYEYNLKRMVKEYNELLGI